MHQSIMSSHRRQLSVVHQTRNFSPPKPRCTRVSHQPRSRRHQRLVEWFLTTDKINYSKEMPQVGSINDRLNKYQSASSLLDEEKQPDSPVTRPNQPKVGKLTDRKDSYLKQANNASSPSHAAVIITVKCSIT